MTIRELFELADRMGVADEPLGLEVSCSDGWYDFSGDTASNEVEIAVTSEGASVTIWT